MMNYYQFHLIILGDKSDCHMIIYLKSVIILSSKKLNIKEMNFMILLFYFIRHFILLKLMKKKNLMILPFTINYLMVR